MSLLVAMALVSSVERADAATSYEHAGWFGNDPLVGGVFGVSPMPQGLDVAESTGYVYVADTGNNAIKVFAPPSVSGACGASCGSLLFEFGGAGVLNKPVDVALDQASGAAYTTNPGAGVNEVQTVSIASASSGTYTLTFDGQTTAAIAFNATSANVQLALEALPTTGVGNVTVSGPLGNNTLRTRTVTFTNALGTTDVAQLTANASGLGGGTVTVNTTTEGVSGNIVKFTPDNPANPTSYTVDGAFTSPPGVGLGSATPAGIGGGIAVDPTTADVVVTSGKAIRRLSSNGSSLGAFDGSSSGTTFNRPSDVAVDGTGDVIASDIVSGGAARVLRFSSGGQHEATLAGLLPGGNHVAVNPATGEVLAGSNGTPRQIYQFEDDVLVRQFSAPDPGFSGQIHGLALRAAAPGRLYALASASLFSSIPQVQVFDSSTSQPPTVTIDAVDADTVTAAEAAFSGTVNPGEAQTAWRFEYKPAAAADVPANWLKAPQPDGDAGSGADDVTVQALAGGLEPNTAYEVRLVATNGQGTTTSALPNPTFNTDAIPPTVATGQAWSITDTTATLVATVNPHNSPVTDCHFAYGTDESYGQTVPCSPAPGAGNDAVQVIAEVDGLSPDTGYHFRIVADNGVEAGPGDSTVEGADAAFTTRLPAAFPQRGYELVSPAHLDGVFAETAIAASTGDHYAYTTSIPAPGSENGVAPYFRATRRPDGSWTQRGIASPAPGPDAPIVNATVPLFSSHDLSIAAFGAAAGYGDPDDQNDANYDTYLEDNEAAPGVFTWLSRDPAIPPGTPQTAPGAALPLYISSDGSFLLFTSERRLLPNDVAATGNSSIYRWDDGQFSLVGIEPGQSTGPVAGSGLGSSNARGDRAVIKGAVSEDGSRVVFQSGSNVNAQRLYVRLDDEDTVEASASTVDTTPRWVHFWGADAAADTVFFTSSSPLTSDSTAPDTAITTGGAFCYANSCDLYAYDVGSESLRDLTPASGGGAVRRVYAVSDDGRRVYFTSTKRLNQAGELTDSGVGLQGVAGQPNLYLAELTESDVSMAFVATLDPGNDPADGNANNGDVKVSEARRQVDASADGSVLAFGNRLPAVPGRQTAGLRQIFVYEADRGELTCASCPPDGGSPTSDASVTAGVPLGADAGITPHSRNVSEDGTVFFGTATPLIEADRNSSVDVYAYRRGQLELVSLGAGSQPTAFGGASADGSTVFISSIEALVPGVDRGIARIYAARVGGGASIPPAPTPPCAGADCRDAVSGAQPERTATPAGLGLGNASPGARVVLTIGGLSRQARARAARAGVLRVRVAANRAGVVRVLARARLGRRVRRVAGESVRLRNPGAATVGLRLSGPARRAIREGRALRVTLRVTSPGARARTSTLLLKAGGRS